MENYKELLERILAKLWELSAKQKDNGINPKHVYLDNQEFIQLLKISPRTSQNLRDSGKVAFTQIGKKIYYRLSDIYEMLEKYKRDAFKK